MSFQVSHQKKETVSKCWGVRFHVESRFLSAQLIGRCEANWEMVRCPSVQLKDVELFDSFLHLSNAFGWTLQLQRWLNPANYRNRMNYNIYIYIYRNITSHRIHLWYYFNQRSHLLGPWCRIPWWCRQQLTTASTATKLPPDDRSSLILISLAQWTSEQRKQRSEWFI